MSDYVAVERADNEAMAELIRQRLEQSGIPCIIESGQTAALSGAGAAYTVAVPSERADDAREVLGE